jgi:GMP synthase (glutamine-hydrolysing)
MKYKPCTVTILQLDTGVPIDRFGSWLADQGVVTSIVPVASVGVPKVGELEDGLIVLGGRMSVTDGQQYPYLESVRQRLREAVAAGVPTLAICLGHQLLAEAFGGQVAVEHEGGEEGAVELRWLDAAADDPVLADAVSRRLVRVPESHHDAVTALPDGAVELARSEALPFQAFRVGSALGVQFHPEASPSLMVSWAEGAQRRGRDCVDPAQLWDEMVDADADVVKLGRSLATGFVKQVRAA